MEYAVPAEAGEWRNARGTKWHHDENHGRQHSFRSGHSRASISSLMDFLRMRFRPDDQWTGELIVGASAAGFAGTGEAWFSIQSLEKFAQAIMAFPLPSSEPPEISGGLGGNEKNPFQELVALTFEPHNLIGGVRATVHLATAFWDGKDHGLHSETTIRLIVTYGDLGRFGPAMLDLINGRIEEAVLTATP